MSKMKFPRQHPRSIIQKRYNHPTSLFVSVPKRIVNQWQLKAGNIVEFVFVTEGDLSFVRIKKILQ